MTWSDLPRNPNARTLRQFAATWLVFFLACGAHQGLIKGRPGLGLAIALLAVVVGLVGLRWPLAVRWVFVGWMMLAFPIGWTLSLVMLLLMYFFVLTPVALFFRLIRRDALARRLDAGAASYWVEKETPSDSRRYFRQY